MKIFRLNVLLFAFLASFDANSSFLGNLGQGDSSINIKKFIDFDLDTKVITISNGGKISYFKMRDGKFVPHKFSYKARR